MLQREAQYIHVRETDLTDWLRREFPHMELHTFYNSLTNVWEIGELHPSGAILEWCVIGPTLQNFSAETANRLRTELRINKQRAGRDIRRKLRISRAEQDAHRLDARREFRKYMNWVMRKTRMEHDPLMQFHAGRVR
jgi:hypothetical protein